jgi:hypothetical protein
VPVASAVPWFTVLSEGSSASARSRCPGVSASILEGLDEMGRAAEGLPQRQTSARHTDGIAMNRNRNVGGREKLPPFEGPQAASDALPRHQQALLGDKLIASKNLAAKVSTNGACCTNISTGTGTIRCLGGVLRNWRWHDITIMLPCMRLAEHLFHRFDLEQLFD